MVNIIDEEYDNCGREEDSFNGAAVVDNCLGMITPLSKSQSFLSTRTPHSTSRSPILPSLNVQHPSANITPQNTQTPAQPRFANVHQQSTHSGVPPNLTQEHDLQSEVDGMLTQSLQSTPAAVHSSTTQERSKYGGKCPRRRQLDLTDRELSEDTINGCSSCKQLKREVDHLRRKLALYQEQNGMPACMVKIKHEY